LAAVCSQVKAAMAAMLEAEAGRAVRTATALRDVLEFLRGGGARGGGTRAAVRRGRLLRRVGG
jgi:hypothetical protein